LSEADLDKMFEKLCESLADKFPKALWGGLGVPEIERLLKFSVAYLAEQHEHSDFYWHLPFMRTKFTSVDHFWNTVAEQLASDVSTVVIIGLNKPWDHWTVAHKVTHKTVEFFDSYGMRRYPFTSFTPDKKSAGDKKGQKILIDVHQTFRLNSGEWVASRRTRAKLNTIDFAGIKQFSIS
jgi:hypothetical protein